MSESFPVIRPGIFGLALAGAAHAMLSTDLRPGLAAAATGFGVLSALHVMLLRSIDDVCRKAIFAGDMCDIVSQWIQPPRSAFFVAEDGGRVVGSIAVKRGGIADYSKGKDEQLEHPEVCTVWKVSSRQDVRGKGIGRALMNRAEEWARMVAGAKSIELITGSIKAKAFYERIGYKLFKGSKIGALFSFWRKDL